MLRNLVVSDYALIDYLSVDFNDGLNVITGETGAGKSIVIDALMLLLGNRGNKTNIRQGAHKMTAQGLFEMNVASPVIEKCGEYGIPIEEGQLILMRETDDRGRNVCRANGLIITVSQLKTLGEELMDIHGQHEHQSLFKRENHRRLLDAFAGEENLKLKKEIEILADEIKEREERLMQQEVDARELEREKENLQFEVNEIKVAALRPEEEAELEDEKHILEHQETLFVNAKAAYQLLRGENSQSVPIVDALGELAEKIAEMAEIDASFKEKAENVAGLLSEAESLSFDVRGYLEAMEYQTADLDEIETRLSVIAKLKRKYGADIPSILLYAEETEARLDALMNRDATLQAESEALEKAQKKYGKLSDRLYAHRIKAAAQLKTALEKELGELAMEKTQLEILVEHDVTRFSAQGQDRVEFLIAVNPGTPPKPLSKVASGGEISRVMLALKSIFGSLDGVETMVFDEIDTGISGRTAQVVAEKIEALSALPPVGRQIICITHLPQIAAMADRHFRVEKHMEAEQVQVDFSKLSSEGKKDELSRMLGGAEVTQKTREHAQEMLEQSRKIKKRKENKILS